MRRSSRTGSVCVCLWHGPLRSIDLLLDSVWCMSNVFISFETSGGFAFVWLIFRHHGRPAGVCRNYAQASASSLLSCPAVCSSDWIRTYAAGLTLWWLLHQSVCRCRWFIAVCRFLAQLPMIAVLLDAVDLCIVVLLCVVSILSQCCTTSSPQAGFDLRLNFYLAHDHLRRMPNVK